MSLPAALHLRCNATQLNVPMSWFEFTASETSPWCRTADIYAGGAIRLLPFESSCSIGNCHDQHPLILPACCMQVHWPRLLARYRAMRPGIISVILSQEVGVSLPQASLEGYEFTSGIQSIVAYASFALILLLAVLVFLLIVQQYWGWLSIDGQGNPVLTSHTLWLGIGRYASPFAFKSGDAHICMTPDSGYSDSQPEVYSVELSMSGLESWACRVKGSRQPLVKTSPIRIHDLMISIVWRFLLSVILGYATFVICFALYVLGSALGEEWRLFELVWLISNGVYGLIATICISKAVLSLANKVTDYLLVKTVCQAIFTQRTAIEISGTSNDSGLIARQTDIARRAISVLLGFDQQAVSDWGRDRAESLMFEGLDSAFGQIIVVELSVIFLVLVMAIWAVLSWHSGDPGDPRLLNIQDALNAGAVLAWLLVVGLSMSAWLAARRSSGKMRSLLLEARSNTRGKDQGVIVSKEESGWRMKSKVCGDRHDLHVKWERRPERQSPGNQIILQTPAESQPLQTLIEKMTALLENFCAWDRGSRETSPGGPVSSD